MVPPFEDGREPASRARTGIRAPAASVAGVVLCGGRSSRLGRDKAAATYGGVTLLARAVAILAELTPDVRLACGPFPRYAELGLPLVLDRTADLGPLGGLEAALAGTQADFVVAIACDMPHLEPRLLAELLDAARARDLDACVLRSERGIEPLCGVWRAALLPQIRAVLARGERKVTTVFEEPFADGSRPRVGFVDADTEERVFNVNTPADLARFAERGTGAER